MKMRVKFNQIQPVDWVSAKNLQAKIKLMNLFGFPAAHNKITAKLTITPGYFNIHQFPGFTFKDPLSDLQENIKTFSEEPPSVYTDKTGVALLPLNLSSYQNATYNVSLYLQGFQKNGGQAVEAKRSILVSPLKFILGYRPDANFNYLKKGSKHFVNVVAVNAFGKAINISNLTLALSRKITISTLMKQQDGTYSYQRKMQLKSLYKRKVTFLNQVNRLLINTKLTPGDYQIDITNNAGRSLAQISYTLVGETESASTRQAELSVHLNKEKYEVGDTMSLAIKTPYAGSGLITIVRDKVYAYKWFYSHGGEVTQSIALPKNLTGNAYVEVDYTRSYTSKDRFMKPFSYTVKPFNLDHSKHLVAINLTANKTVKPGEKLTINYKTNKPAKILIFAANKGVLLAANYHAPNPALYYFAKRALQVRTQQLMDLILPRYEKRFVSAIGGGFSARVGSLQEPYY